uniref:uncharacterized protein LOC109973730 n=1 Tax=Monopterus albus TaxID=43700 RepID=UPI0009B39111|nr:uncharacterized protein LOC109973730 [Monopterus albus]
MCVQKMRPSSFSEVERHRYQAEKMMLRQFMLMKQQDQVPDDLSVRDMKSWLLTGRRFLEEFQEIIVEDCRDLFMAELAWTTARHMCLNQMEQELLEELSKEKQLSQLFNRQVTLEGLQMFLSVLRPAAEQAVHTCLPRLNRKLLRVFSVTPITSGPLSDEDTKAVALMELEQVTAALVPELVDTVLKFLLDKPEQENQSEAASAEIGKLLANSAAACLCQFGSVPVMPLLDVCTMAAQRMVKAIYKRYVDRSRSFHLMDYDESSFVAREGVISAIQDMDYTVETDTSSQADLHLGISDRLKEELEEKREASPEISHDDNVAGGGAGLSTSLIRLETNDQLVALQQEEVDLSVTEESSVKDCDVKKKGGFWRMLTYFFHAQTKE